MSLPPCRRITAVCEYARTCHAPPSPPPAPDTCLASRDTDAAAKARAARERERAQVRWRRRARAARLSAASSESAPPSSARRRGEEASACERSEERRAHLSRAFCSSSVSSFSHGRRRSSASATRPCTPSCGWKLCLLASPLSLSPRRPRKVPTGEWDVRSWNTFLSRCEVSGACLDVCGISNQSSEGASFKLFSRFSRSSSNLNAGRDGLEAIILVVWVADPIRGRKEAKDGGTEKDDAE
mmetsp:Transcript_38562/g.91089  ORF Transcript_38562/g.91089 Transcript_38562/m.91089 type:complete len:241 (+) Transcript_38562:250-972(+)